MGLSNEIYLFIKTDSVFMYFDLWVISYRIQKCEKIRELKDINSVFVLESCRVKLI